MSWDKKHYKEIKEFTLHWLSHRPSFESYEGTPMSHIDFMLTQIPCFLQAEDYEAAKAIKDAIIEFVNKFWGEKYSKEVLLNIPEFKEVKLPPHHITSGDIGF